MAKIEETEGIKKRTLYLNGEDWNKFSQIARQEDMSSFAFLQHHVDKFKVSEVDKIDLAILAQLVDKKETPHQATLFITKNNDDRLDKFCERLKLRAKRKIWQSDIIRYIIHYVVKHYGEGIEVKEGRTKKETRERIEVNLPYQAYLSLRAHARKQGIALNTLLWQHCQDFTDADFNIFFVPVEKGRKGLMKEYHNPDNDPLGPWMPVSLRAKAYKKKRRDFSYDLINNATGQVYPCPETGWIFTQEIVNRMNKENRIIWPTRKNGRLIFKRYLSESVKKVIRTYVTVYPEMFLLMQEQSERLAVPIYDILRAFVFYLSYKLNLSGKKFRMNPIF